MKEYRNRNKISLSNIMTGFITLVVLITLLVVLYIFSHLYRNTMEKNAITNSEQAVVQVKNTVSNYTVDISEIMGMIQENVNREQEQTADFFDNLLEIRPDVVDVILYDSNGNRKEAWTRNYVLKDNNRINLSYIKLGKSKDIVISSPHVVSVFQNDYPWVVTIAQKVADKTGAELELAMDIRFSSIANYVDEVGIGQHGYCFIMDEKGNIVYHPQQQLINAGLKEEMTKELQGLKDGTYPNSNVIYTIKSLENSTWRIVGVSYVDEMITSKVQDMVRIMIAILIVVLITSFLAGLLLSWFFTKPVNHLANAMGEFEKDAENFKFIRIGGTTEIMSLSNSFAHMVVRIQKLMEKVRQEEVTLRKTELNALQAQINPHFLYNTLDSISWMCEEGRNHEAEEMTNALAKLFRISISKGHELIPIEKELQHAESYLKIQKYRYKNRFTYEFDVEADCLPYLCNKITLQPIIENSIVHGFNMVDEGEIRISVRQEKDDIVMVVEDNGVGMTEEQSQEILHKESGGRTGIGIKNVNDRIKIYFGEGYGLTITSELDEGTCVIIRIPRIAEGDYEAK